MVGVFASGVVFMALGSWMVRVLFWNFATFAVFVGFIIGARVLFEFFLIVLFDFETVFRIVEFYFH